MPFFTRKKIPRTRIATIDICEMGVRKHHVAALLEIDVTHAREKIKNYKREVSRISFTAWIIKTIAITIKQNENAAAFLKAKKLFIFDDINISMMVEKEFRGEKVPIPVIIEKADKRSIESITDQINLAKNAVLSNREIVLQKKSGRLEMVYYYLPAFFRRRIWKFVLNHPKLAFSKMGNVAVTSVGLSSNIRGWFIPISIHPVCFGMSSIIKKPIVTDNKIEIREIMNITILHDHDVIDGAPVARFISNLVANVESGLGL